MIANPSPLGPLMIDIGGLSLSLDDERLLASPAVGGIILFDRNFESQAQLHELTAAIRQTRPEILIAVDQEGGRVQRFKEGFLSLPPVNVLDQVFIESPEKAIEIAKQCGWAMAAEVIWHGVDFSFAPVLDLFDLRSEVIKERAFSGSVDTVIALATAYIEGMNQAGMAATGKHYPGHGSVRADSHLELPIDTRSAEEILQNDFEVFVQCAPLLAAVMPAHVKYPALDKDCAGYSRFWLQTKLRDELAFDGVIFSDDLTMAAAADAGALEMRLEKAMLAGCDMLLVCNDREGALKAETMLNGSNLISEPNIRLASMQADHSKISDLYNDERWLRAKAAIESL